MKKNVGSIDKIIRIVFALVVAVLFYFKVISGTFGIILLVLGAVLLVTALVNFCPLYRLFGLSTCPVKQ